MLLLSLVAVCLMLLLSELGAVMLVLSLVLLLLLLFFAWVIVVVVGVVVLVSSCCCSSFVSLFCFCVTALAVVNCIPAGAAFLFVCSSSFFTFLFV